MHAGFVGSSSGSFSSVVSGLDAVTYAFRLPNLKIKGFSNLASPLGERDHTAASKDAPVAPHGAVLGDACNMGSS